MYGSKRRAPPKRILGSALMDHTCEFADGTPASVSTIGFTPMPLYIYSAFTSKCEVILKPAPALAFHPLLRRSLTCPTKGVNPAPTLNVYQCSLASCACPRPVRPSTNTAVTTNRNFPIPILSSTPGNSLTCASASLKQPSPSVCRTSERAGSLSTLQRDPKVHAEKSKAGCKELVPTLYMTPGVPALFVSACICGMEA